jgi:hypothetical protein
MKPGSELIAIERKRQIEELGFDYTNDSLYANNQLEQAAATYALLPVMSKAMLKEDGVPYLWPWDAKYFNPTPNDRIKELTKAGALIAAEIDRLLNLK